MHKQDKKNYIEKRIKEIQNLLSVNQPDYNPQNKSNHNNNFYYQSPQKIKYKNKQQTQYSPRIQSPRLNDLVGSIKPNSSPYLQIKQQLKVITKMLDLTLSQQKNIRHDINQLKQQVIAIKFKSEKINIPNLGLQQKNTNDDALRWHKWKQKFNNKQ